MLNEHYKFIERKCSYYIVEKELELGSSSNSATSYDLEQVMYLSGALAYLFVKWE